MASPRCAGTWASFPRPGPLPCPAPALSTGITVCTLVSTELHNSLSAKALESSAVAISAASLLRQETGLKEQREGGGLDSCQGRGSLTPDSCRPSTQGGRIWDPWPQAGVGRLQPCLQKDTPPRLSPAFGSPGPFWRVSHLTSPALCPPCVFSKVVVRKGAREISSDLLQKACALGTH